MFIETDRIQHVFWGKKELKLYWKYLDDFIGELTQIISLKAEKGGEDIYLILVSDHGFCKLNGKIDVNCLLNKAGILRKVHESTVRGLGSFLRRILYGLLIILASIYSGLPKGIKEILSPLAFKLLKSKYGSVIILKHYDYINSLAFCVNEASCGHLLLNPLLTGDERRSVLSKIRTILESLKDEGTGEPLVRVLDGKEVYEDPSPGVVLPDLVVIPREGYLIASTTSPSCLIKIESDMMTRGVHGPHGIFLIRGPEIKSNYRVKNAKIYDILPTILHILGIPIPRDIDGRILREVFESSILSQR
ncbi:MAG: alkaline phosphatase family protein [Candidatus Korarchaeum sp.]|nr:alkaline phosphatase family protein [Candidatus Korarchaeum sp.]